jgi:uncharacterized repeat protein (TIGR01451 family)
VGGAAAGNGPANGGVDALGNMTLDFGLVQRIDLTIAKTVTSTGPYTPGASNVTYSLVASNRGPATAQAAIVVKDRLPAGLNLVSATGTNWSCAPATGNGPIEVTCTRSATASTLAANAAADTITVTAAVAATASGSLQNVAQVNPSATETIPESNPLGTTDSGYEDANNATGSNNDSGAQITVGSATYSLGNRVWNDMNNDGVFNLGEVGLSGVTVRLLDGAGSPTGQTTTTDGSGYYQFTGLAAGNYIVEIVPPAGYVSSSGANGVGAGGPYETAGNANNTTFNATSGTTDHGVAIAGGNIRTGVIALGDNMPVGEGADHPASLVDPTPDNRSNRNVDFGLFAPASLGTVVWIDNGAGGGTAGDGVKQPGEPGIPGVVVRLLNGSGAAILNPATGQPITVTTDANGNYSIGNLAMGDYAVEFVFPAGSQITTTINPAGSGTPVAGPDAQRNEMNPTTRRSPVISLAPGQNNPNLDAGVRSFNTTVEPAAIPTLSEWMLMLLGLLVVGSAATNPRVRLTMKRMR